MKKRIEADILDINDFFEKYNKDLVSRDLINYILDNSKDILDNDEVEIVLNKAIDIKLESILRTSLKTKYQEELNEHYHNNKMQVVYFFIGVLMLIISRIFNDRALIEELFLIGGWVLIWQTVEIEFFRDTLNHKKRKILKKLINSKIIEKNI